MDLINILVFSGDVTGDIKMKKKTHISLLLETHNCSAWVPLLKVLEENSWKQSFGKKVGFSTSMFEIS